MHQKLNGVLMPKTNHTFSTYPKFDLAEWDNVFWDDSQENAVIEHQQHQAGYPTSGISTTPHLSRAKFYAFHNNKYSKAYIYVINRLLCESHGVSEFVVNNIVPKPSCPEDDEVILVANDFQALPSSLIIEIKEISL